MKHSICTIACRCITNCAALQNAYVPTASRQKNACRTCTAPSVTPSRPQRIPHEANQEYCMYQVDQRTAQAPNATILHLLHLPSVTTVPIKARDQWHCTKGTKHTASYRINRTNRTNRSVPTALSVPYQTRQAYHTYRTNRANQLYRPRRQTVPTVPKPYRTIYSCNPAKPSRL